MSRVGKNPVTIPAGVEVALKGRVMSIKGKLGTLNWTVPYEIEAKKDDKTISFKPRHAEDDSAGAMWGTARALTVNMIKGVSQGFQKKLELQGVGYRAALQGKKLSLSVGYSSPKEMNVPEGLTVAVNENTQVLITGADKQKVGQFAAEVRAVRPPEPYKGKGIRYAGEHVVMKEGKKK